jgi:uncharacterized membrane protein YgdD (TMEM256/DUF423 family)
MTAASWRRVWLLAAGLLGAAAVGLGAYAAHGLAGAEQELVEKASRYGLIHALALLALAQSPSIGRLRILAGLLFIAGSLLFCGALVGLGVFAWPVAFIAPFGGSAFILGWLALAGTAIGGESPPGV